MGYVAEDGSFELGFVLAGALLIVAAAAAMLIGETRTDGDHDRAGPAVP
ncbi:MAG: hypothetical protein GY778_10030 [bacterium]|nr:hypothetical protein [bacterium]